MSNVGPEGRSYKAISHSDLLRLAEIALHDRIVFFEQHPSWSAYQNRVICTALCQGAAQHFVDSKTGINDFDVYTFFKKDISKRFYSKRIKSYDFGDAKFGQSLDKPNFVGRRVDCLFRAIDVSKGEDEINSVLKYLSNQETKTAKFLAQKAVILLDPDCGKIIWPIGAASFSQ